MVHCREEVFGPVLAVVKFQTDAEAIGLANDCPFGLGSTVFSASKSRANAIARQLQVHSHCLSVKYMLCFQLHISISEVQMY